MPSITLPLAEAIQSFSAVLPHCSKDDQTPVITEIEVNGNGGEATASLIATDRYTVGRYELSAGISETFRVPRLAAEWISKIATAALRRGKHALGDYSLRIECDDSDTTVTILCDGKAERVQSFDLPCSGNFPPVARLLDQAKESVDAYPIGILPHQLEKLTGYARKFEATEPITFTQTARGSNKPGPLMFSIGKLSGLIQPALSVR